jgi:hypothetical protein
LTVFPTNTFLGIAVGERTLKLAELGPSAAARGRWEVRRAAEFELPAAPGAAAAAPSEDPAGVAAALGRFLKDNGFTAGRAVVGVPARWVVSRDRELPPSAPEQAADALRLQAERLFSAEPRELVFDYAGNPSADGPRNVLLVGMPRRQLERVVGWLREAGVRVLAVTPTTLALAASSSPPGSPVDGLLLNLSRGEVEVSSSDGGVPRLLRHLPVRGSDLASANGTRGSGMAALAGEIKRVVSLAPRGPGGGDGAVEGVQGPRAVVLWDGVGLDAREEAELARHAGVEIKAQPDLSTMGVTVALAAPGAAARPAADAASMGPAVALALAAAGRASLAVDFLHSKLTPRKARRVGRRGAWAVSVVGVLAALGLALAWDLSSSRSAVDAMRAKLAEIGPNVVVAEQTADRVESAAGWFDARPPALECLRELTLAFPDGGERVYVTSFSFRGDSGRGQIGGRSSDQRHVLALLDRMKANTRFADVKLLDIRHAGGESREHSFSLSFAFADAAGPAAGAAPPPAPTPGRTSARLPARTPAPR